MNLRFLNFHIAMQNSGKLTTRSNKQNRIFFIHTNVIPPSLSESYILFLQCCMYNVHGATLYRRVYILFITIWNMIRIHIDDYFLCLFRLYFLYTMYRHYIIRSETEFFVVDAIFIEVCSPFLYHIRHISETLCSYK